MVLFPKEPFVQPHYKIYKGHDPEEHAKNGPMRETEDVIENLGSLSDKLWFAAKTGFKLGFVFSVYEITHHSRLIDRRLQLARAAFFTIPTIAMTTGWMGALETAKQALGRDMWQEAQFLAAGAPAAIYAVWRKRPYSAIPVWFCLGMAGVAYQFSVDNNMALYKSTSFYNPNEPSGTMDRKNNFFDMATPLDSGLRLPLMESYKREPTWKKFE